MRPTSRGAKQTGCPREELCHKGPGYLLGYQFTFGFSLLTEHKVELQVMIAETPTLSWKRGKETYSGQRSGHHLTDSMDGDQSGTET